MIFELIFIHILLVHNNLLNSVSGVNALLPYGDFNFVLSGIIFVFYDQSLPTFGESVK